MAKGSYAKAEIMKKLLATFEGSFLYDDGKELRIPFIEDGETIQIKVALTCAKVNVEPETTKTLVPESTVPNIPKGTFDMTNDEKKDVIDIIEKLNL